MYSSFNKVHRHRMRTPFQRKNFNRITLDAISDETGSLKDLGSLKQGSNASHKMGSEEKNGKYGDFAEPHILRKTN